MARPRQIPTERILKAARQLFLEHGFSCPTAHIAKAAGVSEGTVFKRFGSKSELFRSALNPPRFPGLAALGVRVGHGSTVENMTRLASELLAHFRVLIPTVVRLKTRPDCGSSRQPDLGSNRGLQNVLKEVTAYLADESRLGRLQHSAPDIMARTLLGSVHSYVFFEYSTARTRVPAEDEAFVTGLVQLMWHGVAPAPSTVKS